MGDKLNPSLQLLSAKLTYLRTEAERLTRELSETQSAITSHLKTIELIKEYEQTAASKTE